MRSHGSCGAAEAAEVRVMSRRPVPARARPGGRARTGAPAPPTRIMTRSVAPGRRIFQVIAKARVRQDGTSLYDAVARALCYMRSAHHDRRALVVITDGADQNSHRSLDELIPIVQASQAQVFAMGYFGKEEFDLYRSSDHKKV